MKKPLVTVPQELLRHTSTPVVVDKKIKQFLTDLADTLVLQDNPKGVGLSAPQIGKNWRVFGVLMNEEKKTPTPADVHFFINPEIIATEGNLTLGEDPEDPVLEGCLSIPHLYGPVPRYPHLTIAYETLENGEVRKKEEEYHDFFARVIQHEYDHLEGVLFTDYVLKYSLPLYEQRHKRMVEIDPALAKAF